MRQALAQSVDDGGPRRGAGDDRAAVERRCDTRLLRARGLKVLEACGNQISGAHAIDATLSPELLLLDGVEVNLTHWLISTQPEAGTDVLARRHNLDVHDRLQYI